MRRAACALLAAASLGAAGYLAKADYPIGLDFEGGAMFELPDGDPDAALQALHELRIHRFTLERKRLMVPDMTQKQADQFQSRVHVEYASVIAPVYPPFYGRPLAVAIALVAAAAWILAIFRPAMMAVGGGALGMAAVIVFYSSIGGTLSHRTYYKGAFAALPACIACAWLAYKLRRTSPHPAA